MSLIKNSDKEIKNKVELHLSIDESVILELVEYIKWAELEDTSHFIEEACKHVFHTDGAWKQFKQDHLGAVSKDFSNGNESDIDIANQMVGEDEGMINLEDDQNLGRELQKKNTQKSE
jgi:hypothetical protein